MQRSESRAKALTGNANAKGSHQRATCVTQLGNVDNCVKVHNEVAVHALVHKMLHVFLAKFQ